jgi:rSAM/selenodomain-associated transferase 2
MTPGCTVSIIIPTYNEQENIGRLLQYLHSHLSSNIADIIVADGSSTDDTLVIAAGFPVTVLSCPQKGRSAQMNYGASQAKGDILYFLHADTLPPTGFDEDIRAAVSNGADAGCFRLSFDESSLLLKLVCFIMRLDLNVFRYGDQSFFIRQKLYYHLGGFDEKLTIMEDYDIVVRAKRNGRFHIIPKNIVTSAIKFRQNGELRLLFIFVAIWLLYNIGWNQERLVAFYKRHIRQEKI